MESEIYKLSIFNLLDSIGAATFIIDKENIVVYWNKACENLTGVSAEEVINTNEHWKGFYSSERPCLADVVLMRDDETSSKFYNNVEKAKGSKHGFVSFNWCDTPSGLKYLAFEANALFDENNNVIGAIETLRDISELKYAEVSQGKLALKHKKLFELTKIDFYNTEEAFKAYLSESTKELSVNRASLWKYSEDRTKLICLYSLHDGIFETKETSIDIEKNLDYIANIETQSYLAVNDVRQNLLVSDISDFLENENIVSLLDVPIVIDGKIQYILCHENTGPIKEWSSEDKDFVRSVGDIIANKLISIKNKENENKLKYYAAHDSLTGLLNRYSFDKEITRLIEYKFKVKNNTSDIVFFMDLDQFKVINDTCGHKAGDELIKSISQLLQNSIRDNDILARLGGDEFGLLLKNCSEDNATKIADKIIQNIADFKFIWNHKQFRIGISIGITSFSEYDENIEEILSQADTACYIAKDKGRNRFHLYESTDEETNEKRSEMRFISKIQKAIDEKKFDLYLQAIIDLKDNEISHYEVLVRMRDENNEIIAPGNFIPSAERYNLMSRIDIIVVQKAFSLLDKLYKQNINISVSINISGHSISNEKFLAFLCDTISDHKHISKNVSFELTETAAVSNRVVATNFINTISKLGCKFALDDFGSGVSSYGYLKHLPFDILKIDGIFVKDISNDPISQAVIRSINEVSHILGMTTVAEYVENDEIKKVLIDIGIDYAQGYGIQKPFPASNLLN